MFGPRRITPLPKLLGGARPRSRGIKRVVAALSPRPIRRIAVEKAMRHMADRPWLRPKAQEAFLETLVADALMEPLQWSASLRLLPLRRAWLTGKHNLSVLAALHDIRYLHPLMDETFVTAVSRGPR